MSYLKYFLVLTFSMQIQAKPCKNIIEAFLELYPHHTKEMIFTRLQNAKDKHNFIRGFIPYYYKEAYEARHLLPVHHKLHVTHGQIAGDAHVENFGFLVNDNGKAVFSLNDFDDVGLAPLYLDVMRLSQSAAYMTEVKQGKVIAAYKKGLQNSDYDFSNFIKKLEAKAQAGGVTSKADYVATAQGLSFTNKAEPHFNTTVNEISEFEKVVNTKFGNTVKLHDSYRTMKESGGSAFGTRYHLLIEIDKKIHLIELKEVFDSGVIAPFAVHINNEQRILSARNIFLGADFDQKLTVVQINKRPFQLRFKSEGNKSVDFSKIKETEVHQVIEDEFFILGQLHRKSLHNSPQEMEAYVKNLNKVTTEEWKESVEVMMQKMNKAFKKSQQ